MQAKEAEQQHQQKMQEEQLASMERQKQMDLQFKADQANLDRQNNITIAEIRSAGYGAQVDINENQQSDYMDALEKIQDDQQYYDQMNLKRESELVKKEQGQQKLDIERQRDRNRENTMMQRCTVNKIHREKG